MSGPGVMVRAAAASAKAASTCQDGSNSISRPFALAAAALTITPGPDMTYFLSQTVGRSRAAGIAAYAGSAIGILLHTTMVAVGLSALLVASATAFAVLKVVGALYLLWLALDAVRNGSAFHLENNEAGRKSLRGICLKGFLVNVLNPKVIVFFLTFLPQFVSPTDPHAHTKLFTLGIFYVVVATPITLAMIASAGSLATALRQSHRLRRTVDYIFASVLGAFAIKLLATRAGS